MKNALIITVLNFVLLIAVSCDDNNSTDYTNNHSELLGTWKYVEFLGFDVNCPDCGPYLITDGFTITFYEDGTFSSNELADYPKGKFVISSADEITLTYHSATLNPITKIKKISSISKDGMILEPIPTCFEGCSERYEKILTP